MLKKIAIVGPESTGKSTLAKALADHYQTEWVPEYARSFIDQLHRPYHQSDLVEIAKGQLADENEKNRHANGFLFCDTDLIIIKVWSDHKYGYTDPWIEEQLQTRNYDFHLLTSIDLPWEYDPQREHPDLRSHFYDVYKTYLDQNDLPYATVQGKGVARTQAAITAITSFFRTD